MSELQAVAKQLEAAIKGSFSEVGKQLQGEYANFAKQLAESQVASRIVGELTSAAITGKFKGPKGDKGDKGDSIRGPQGEPGPGPSASVIRQEVSFFFKQNPDFFKGSPGEPGLLDPKLILEAARTAVKENVAELRGPPGETIPPQVNLRGDWNGQTDYDKGAIVAYVGDLWYREIPGRGDVPRAGNKNWRLFLAKALLGRISGYGVVQGQGSGGSGTVTNVTSTAAFLNVATGTTTPVLSWSGLTANALLYSTDATTLAQDGTNLLYTTSSGPTLQVGSGNTTSAGLTIGHLPTLSGWAAMYHTGVTPNTANYIIACTNGGTVLNSPGGTGSVQVAMGGVTKLESYGIAGKGTYLTAGTATTDVQALSATQTWNASGVTFTAIKAVITDSASAAGSLLMDLQTGNGSQFSVGKGGAITTGGTVGVASFGPSAVTSITVKNGIITAIS